MDVRQLRYFVGVVNSGSFSDASLYMHVAQSALSRHIKSLEHTVGGELLERHPKGITPTKLGWHLYEQAKRIVTEVEELPSKIRDKNYKIKGQVTLGAPNSVARDLFPLVADLVMPTYPGISLSFVEGNAISLGSGLDTGEIDIAIMVDPDRRLEFHYEPLFSEQMYLFGKCKDSEFPVNNIKITDLPKYPLVLPSRRNGPRRIIDRALFKSNVALNIKFEVSGSGIVSSFIQRGIAMGVLTHSMLLSGEQKKDLQVAAIDKLVLTYHLVSNRGLSDTPHTRTIMNIVRENIGILLKTDRFFDAKPVLI
ncbi:MAG: LysR family transcriptional regulator [Rhodospirillales bacterium]